MRKLVATVESMERANAIVRNLVRSDVLSIGITDWSYVNRMIRDRQCAYSIYPRFEFDEVGDAIDCDGGYEIWKERIEGFMPSFPFYF